MKHIVIVARSMEGDDNWSRHERNHWLTWMRLNDKTYSNYDPTEEELIEISSELIARFGTNIDNTHWVQMVDEDYFNEFHCPYY